MRVGMCLLLASLSVIAAGCGPKERGEWHGLAQPEVLDAAGLQYYWRVNLDLGKKERIDRLYLLNGDLLCLTNMNRLLAVDATRGIWRWTQNLASPRQRVFAPVAVKGVALPTWVAAPGDARPTSEMIASAQPFDAIILNTLSDVLVLDRANGRLVMKIPLGFATNAGGAFGFNSQGVPLYYVTATDGLCHGIDLRNGISVWRVPTPGMTGAAPALHDGILYLAGDKGIITATRVAYRPAEIWRNTHVDSQRMHGPVTARLHADDRGCFVPCQDNRLYAFDRLNGHPLWPPVVCQGPLRNDVQVGAESVFQRAEWDQFYAVDLASGKVKWTLLTGETVLAVMREKTSRVYVIDVDNYLHIVQEASGAEVASLPMTGYEVYLPNARLPVIYAATRAGRVVCIRSNRAKPLTPEMLSD